jgi:hypothetical protein
VDREPTPRFFSRRILRGYTKELARLGLLDDVVRGASPELSSLLGNPGLAPAWVRGGLLDELLRAVESRRGREAARALGLEMMKSGGLTEVLTPIIRFSLEFVGKTPAALFANVQGLASVISRGTKLTWIAREGSAGTIRLRSEEPVPEVSWAPWEGAFSYAFHLTGTSGTVERARPGADGCSCEIGVAWEQADHEERDADPQVAP